MRNSQDSFAVRADQFFEGTASVELEDSLMSVLVAICTYLMRRFFAAHVFFYDVSERSSSDFLKFIALLLCFPCFKLSHASFKLAYRINQFRLRRLCREDFFLKFDDRRVSSGGVVDVLQSLRDIKRGLDGAKPAITSATIVRLLRSSPSLAQIAWNSPLASGPPRPLRWFPNRFSGRRIDEADDRSIACPRSP